jgi:hypothetical protein
VPKSPPPRHPRRIHQGDAAFPATPGPPPGIQAPPGVVRSAGMAPQQAGPPLEVLAAEFEQLVQSNQVKFQSMIATGNQPDPMYLIHARINHLIDAIAQAAGPNGPRWALMTRLGFERQIAADLDQAGPAARRMQLAEGARYTPQMIAELARQTGTLVRVH